MLVAENRPRTLSWRLAGPLLFGDWGTSRLYVLGLAFYYTAHASVVYLAAMSVIMAGVAWGYTIVCRCFPDGGGVYSATRQLNPLLSVIAATLLFCGFILTAALSAVEAFHYFGIENKALVVQLSIATFVVLGIVNWYGAQSAGRFAFLIATAALLASAVIGALCIPYLPKGLASVKWSVDGVSAPWQRWESLVRIILALSGVEAVASMTGLMKLPVLRTARLTIWPVLLEVVLLNMVFGIALTAMPGLDTRATPDYVAYELRQGLSSDAVPQSVVEYRATGVRLLASETSRSAFGGAAAGVFTASAGIIFGLLLLSAVNTAIMAMVSVAYALAQDRELPRVMARLNYSGVPWAPLLLAILAPATILLFVSDDKALGELYAIGVVGAIAINFVSCAANRALDLKRWERRALWILGALMSAIELTIIVAKPHATAFAGGIIAGVLAIRYALRALRPPVAEPIAEPARGWIEEIRAAAGKIEAGRPRIMLAARGRENAEFAVDLARRRGAALFAIYVRTLRVLDVQPDRLPRIESDAEAQATLGTVALIARQANVPFFPIYVTASDIASELLDYTVTYACDTLILGKSRRTIFARRLAGDVVATVAANLPEGVSLISRATPRVAIPTGPPDATPATRDDEPPDDAPPPS